MASLTESYQISELMMEQSKKPPNNNNNNWFDSVYLCIQNSESSHPLIDGFRCYKFNNFEEADNYSNYYLDNYKIMTGGIQYHRHTMIPVCKWVPYRFHKFVINYKLQNKFWKNNITLMFKK
jgi:hypothetical protein